MVDLVFHNGRVHTMDDDRPYATALAIEGGAIAAVGGDEEVLARRTPRTRVVDLRGATALPGLGDSHCHMVWLGQTQEAVDLGGARSFAEAVEMVRERAAATPRGAWITGWRWNQEQWEDKSLPHHSLLSERVPDHPVWLLRVDTHAGLANAAAMERAGITGATPAPPGGLVATQDGKPTGILVDTAMPLVEARIPAPTVEDARRLILAAQEHCLAYGLTQVHDPGIDATMLAAYRSLAADDELRMRVHAMVRQEHVDEVGLTRVEEGLFTLRCVKVLMDGALGSYGAALEAPYADAPHETGLLRVTPEALRDTLERSYRSGFQVSVHAIGDRTNRLALDAIEETLRRVPTADHRTRIEHAQILRPQDVPRFARLGVIASVQPAQCTSDIAMSDVRLGPRRTPNAYMWRSLLEAGTTLTGGSDAPVESANPLWGVYAAVTRQDHQGRPADGWRPEQRMTRREALAAYTFGPAYASFQDDDRGVLRPGQWADLTIVDRDVVDGPVAALLDARVVATVVAGKVVFDRLP